MENKQKFEEMKSQMKDFNLEEEILKATKIKILKLYDYLNSDEGQKKLEQNDFKFQGLSAKFQITKQEANIYLKSVCQLSTNEGNDKVCDILVNIKENLDNTGTTQKKQEEIEQYSNDERLDQIQIDFKAQKSIKKVQEEVEEQQASEPVVNEAPTPVKTVEKIDEGKVEKSDDGVEIIDDEADEKPKNKNNKKRNQNILFGGLFLVLLLVGGFIIKTIASKFVGTETTTATPERVLPSKDSIKKTETKPIEKKFTLEEKKPKEENNQIKFSLNNSNLNKPKFNPETEKKEELPVNSLSFEPKKEEAKKEPVVTTVKKTLIDNKKLETTPKIQLTKEELEALVSGVVEKKLSKIEAKLETKKPLYSKKNIDDFEDLQKELSSKSKIKGRSLLYDNSEFKNGDVLYKNFRILRVRPTGVKFLDIKKNYTKTIRL